MEQVELHPELAVVPGARLFEPLQVRVEVGLRVERGAVDAGQLLVVLVAAPVGTGEPGQLERLDRLRVLKVRAAAEVGEITLGIQRDVPFGGVDELDLVRLVLGGEARLCFIARDLLAGPHATFLQLALDLVLDRREVGLGDRLRELEVVVEAVLDRRADRDLHAGVEPAHRLGQKVRRGMAQDVERVGVVRVTGGEELDLLAVGERQPQVLHRAVRANEHRLLGELGADRTRGVEPRGAVGKFEL